jgi:hypothetical protein
MTDLKLIMSKALKKRSADIKTSRAFLKQHIELHRLTEDDLFIDEGTEEVIGTCTDGEEVSIGDLSYPLSLSAYLDSYPSPKHW